MKKALSAILLAALFLVISCSAAFAAQPITVIVQGEKLKFDVQPEIEDGRVMVPLRAIFEALGANVEWDPKNQTVYAEKDYTAVEITVNEERSGINGIEVLLDVPAKLNRGRVMVPLRFSSEAFGATVEWDSKTSTANIFYRPGTGVETKSLEPLEAIKSYSEFPDIEYYPIKSSENMWVVIDTKLYLYETDKKLLIQVMSLDNEGSNYTFRCLDNGQMIVFEEDVFTDLKNIYTIESPTKITKVAVSQKINTGYSAISSRGEILLWGDVSPADDIWKVGLDGKVVRLVNTPDIFEQDPQWSPDGTKVVFNTYDKGPNSNPFVTVIDSDGSNKKTFYDSDKKWLTYLQWSEDSKYLACHEVKSDNIYLWVIDVENNNKKMVYQTEDWIQFLRWSPDNRKIAVQQGSGNLVILDLNTNKQLQLYSNPYNDVAWSPDGKKFLFDRFGQIWLCDPDQGTANAIIIGYNCEITWKDENAIYFISEYENQVYMAELTADS